MDAKGNAQLLYYALGALGRDNPYMIERVEMAIIQPNAIGKAPVDRWSIPVEDLYKWAHEVLLPAALATEAPDAPCNPGEWCCFCEASHLCPARQQAAIALLDDATIGHPVATLPAVDALPPERIGLLSAFFTGAEFQSWVKALAAAEQSLLASGVAIPGRKLVETIVLGNRRWADDEAVTQALGEELGGELLMTKLKSPAQVEKLLASRGMKPAERKSLLDPLVTRDESTKTVVVNEGDPRAALESKQSAVDLFD